MEGCIAARAAYDVIAAVVAGESPKPARVTVASRAPTAIWERVLALEACGAWLDHERRLSTAVAATLVPSQSLLRASSAGALRAALMATHQAAQIAIVAETAGVRALAVKGVARLLLGEPPGRRTMSDIDFLVDGSGAEVLHDALQSAAGYTVDAAGIPARHLPTLVRAASLPVEIHRRVSDAGTSPMERRIWMGTQRVTIGSASFDIPDATAMLMHALEHAVVVHRAARFRLRDVLDVAALSTEAVDWLEVRRFVSDHDQRSALWTLLGAASSVPGSRGGPDWALRGSPGGAQTEAWRRVRRVGRARLLAPARAGMPPASDPRVLVLSQLAQGSASDILRLMFRAIVRPKHAVRLIAGDWLPVEAEEKLPANGVAGRTAG